jgi:hypothetical protein
MQPLLAQMPYQRTHVLSPVFRLGVIFRELFARRFACLDAVGEELHVTPYSNACEAKGWRYPFLEKMGSAQPLKET